MHHWIIVAILTYTAGVGMWVAGVFDERDHLRKENATLHRILEARQPWRRYTNAGRRTRKIS